MNKRAYSSLFPDSLAHIFFIAKVETCEGEPLVEYGVTELPECIVCLERMDESVTGLNLTSTILCNHTFHGKCLKQWNNQKCPICRYIQSPNLDGYNDEDTEVQSSSKMGVNNRNACGQCQEEGDPEHPNSTLGLNPKVQELWICLVCGIVGCGRYDKQHASDHFMSTGHNYTMSLSNNRVWDYQNDVFVHRLFQTSGVSENEANEGKLVEKQMVINENCCSSEKPIEKQILELEMQCMQVLSQQLDTQRQYWEARLQEEKQEWQTKQLSLSSNRITNETQTETSSDTLGSVSVETDLKKELIKVKTVYSKCAKQLQDEKAVSKALTENLTITQKERDGMKEQMRNLEELNRDLTFHFQAQSNEAIQEATVLNVSPNKEKSKNSSSRRKKR